MLNKENYSYIFFNQSSFEIFPISMWIWIYFQQQNLENILEQWLDFETQYEQSYLSLLNQ